MRVAVIGAGASGLAAGRWLRDAGLETVIYERWHGVGGLWRGDTGIAYPSLRTNTSKHKTAFSDLPFGEDIPDFPRRDDVVAYLERYAIVTGVRSAIRFDHTVRSVRQAIDGWTVDGERFDRVVVCSGLFSRTMEPKLPGRERFRGVIAHSHTYRDPSRFAGLHVVVAGAGSSGADIATELTNVAASVTVAIREMPVFTPRQVDGRPYDHRATRLAHMLPARVRRERARRVLDAEYARRGLQRDPTAINVTPGTDLLDAIADRRVALRPALGGLDETGALFADGTRTPADAIILATGYHAEFPFLPPDIPERIHGALALYRLVFPPAVGHLAFAGVTRVQGPVFAVIELQARWIAAVFAGHATLPSAATMRAEIDERIGRAHRRGDDQMRVELLPYLDDLAGRIGARPSLWRHPHLLVKPVSAADYRSARPTVPHHP